MNLSEEEFSRNASKFDEKLFQFKRLVKDIRNQRQISTLPSLGTVNEKLIHSRLYFYFIKYNTFNENHFRFQSTNQPVMTF